VRSWFLEVEDDFGIFGFFRGPSGGNEGGQGEKCEETVRLMEAFV
jgi:hypothetical protein